MTNLDPSPPEDDSLDFLAESLDPEERFPDNPTPPGPSPDRDEDRLYTDEFMRQDEKSSRILFISFISAGAICIGVGLWYFATRSQTPQPGGTPAPLPVPAQPSLTSPNFSPGQTGLPTVPLPNQSQPPTDSGVLPNEKPLTSPGLASPRLTSPTLAPPPPPSQ